MRLKNYVWRRDFKMKHGKRSGIMEVSHFSKVSRPTWEVGENMKTQVAGIKLLDWYESHPCPQKLVTPI